MEFRGVCRATVLLGTLNSSPPIFHCTNRFAIRVYTGKYQLFFTFLIQSIVNSYSHASLPSKYVKQPLFCQNNAQSYRHLLIVFWNLLSIPTLSAMRSNDLRFPVKLIILLIYLVNMALIYALFYFFFSRTAFFAYMHSLIFNTLPIFNKLLCVFILTFISIISYSDVIKLHSPVWSFLYLPFIKF